MKKFIKMCLWPMFICFINSIDNYKYQNKDKQSMFSLINQEDIDFYFIFSFLYPLAFSVYYLG